MRERNLAGPVIDRLAAAPQKRFADSAAWAAHLAALGLDRLVVLFNGGDSIRDAIASGASGDAVAAIDLPTSMRAVVVRKDGPVKTVPDLRGRTIAIPSRFSDERLVVFRALEANGMTAKDVKMVEMAPRAEARMTVSSDQPKRKAGKRPKASRTYA